MKKFIRNSFFLILSYFIFSPSIFGCSFIFFEHDYTISSPVGDFGIMAIEGGPTNFLLGPLRFSLPFAFYPSITIIFGVPTVIISSFLIWQIWFKRSVSGSEDIDESNVKEES